MKHSMIALCLSLSFCTSAWTQPAPKPTTLSTGDKSVVPSPVMDPVARSNMLIKTGGLLPTPVKGPSILFLNTQTRVSEDSIGLVPNQIHLILRLPVAVSSKPSKEPLTDTLAALKDSKNAAVLVIADSSGYPSLLVAPESRWAMVNVAALNTDGTTAEKLAERVQKETWRAFGYLMGAANSQTELSLLKPVFSVADLDALSYKSLAPDAFSKISSQAAKLGITPSRMTTYRKAVEEGWAPAPTNDFQRTIWNELKKQ